MKYLKTFEKWSDKFISKSYAENWIKKNGAKAIELSKKDRTIGEELTKDEQKFMDKYTTMYDIVNSKENKEFYDKYPAAHKSTTYKKLYKNIKEEFDRTDIFGKKWRTMDDSDIFDNIEIVEHDVVELKDGRTGTIVHIYPGNENYIIEIGNETETINKKQIKKVIE